ncbi:gala protein [Streptomyces qinzhouensis]|uniref:Gala protein n=1 Tax=Streptomyces qinzhouensis TaxID=2599401 RepID=A0A5B8IFM9_9ACTN|nr:gala protein [Streptomyces qinzhouensis]QDY77388.1 gala protein [Streptomyces qinzhouensis]
MDQPTTPVRCPAIEHPDLPLADPALLTPLMARLADARPVAGDETFPLGTLRADGRVDLCKRGLGPEGAARLLPAATGSPHAAHLLLGTNALGDDGARSVAAALTAGTTHGIRTLYLGCNRIGPDGVTALADALAEDTTVRALWLKRNPVTATGARTLAVLLRRNSTLRTLDLVNSGIGPEGVRILLDALLDRGAPLERLFLGGNGLTASDAPLLAALVRDAGVRELYLPANHLGDEGTAVLAAATDPARPVRLGLGGNGIGPAGARALADALDGIETLDLGRAMSERSLGSPGNTTGDDGARTLAAALPGSPLRRLELCHTGITGRGAKSLLAALPEGHRLEYVGLGPGTPRRVKRSFAERLRPVLPTHPDLRAIGSVYR